MRKIKKIKFLNVLSVGLILSGMILIAYVLSMRVYLSAEQKNLQDEFLKMKSVVEVGEKNFSEKNIEVSPVVEVDDNQIDYTKAIALMKIPKIDQKVAVIEGVELKDLKKAVGHFIGTAFPGEEGNFAVAGHRSYTFNEYFNRVNELEIGDDIIVETPEMEFTYTIYDIFEVTPDKIEVIEKVDDKIAITTLVTCTKDGKNRIIIRGELKNQI